MPSYTKTRTRRDRGGDEIEVTHITYTCAIVIISYLSRDSMSMTQLMKFLLHTESRLQSPDVPSLLKRLASETTEHLHPLTPTHTPKSTPTHIQTSHTHTHTHIHTHTHTHTHTHQKLSVHCKVKTLFYYQYCDNIRNSLGENPVSEQLHIIIYYDRPVNPCLLHARYTIIIYKKPIAKVVLTCTLAGKVI